MRQRKIRGHNKIQRQIENWRTDNLQLDLDYLQERKREYVKIRVRPFSDLSLTNTIIPQPKRKTKLQILAALLDIYDSWKTQLDKSGQPYYLKVWFMEPRFSTSQVVVAIDDKIEYYNNLFPPADKSIKFPLDKFKAIKDKLNHLTWTPFLDEDPYFESEFTNNKEQYATEDDYNYDQRLFKKIKENHNRKFTIKTDDGEDICYCKTRGIVWCGA